MYSFIGIIYQNSQKDRCQSQTNIFALRTFRTPARGEYSSFVRNVSKVLKEKKKKKLALTSFYYVSREICLSNSKKLICIHQSRFYIFSHPREFKMFNITSKYFNFLNNKPPARWVAHFRPIFSFLLFCNSRPHALLALVISWIIFSIVHPVWMSM